jgi:histidinol-phosphate aminotransferase
MVKLSSNENPFPPLPSVVAAIAAAAAEVRQYPDPAATRLIDSIADFMDVPSERVAVGTGAVSLVTYLALAAAGPGDEIVYAWRSFEAYPIVAALAGATPVAIPLEQDGRHDLAAMAAAVNDRTRLVFLCSPNNPTGPTLSREEVRGFLAAVPDDLLVVLDEAYAEYVRDPFAVSGIRDFLDRPNVVVLRSFSKAYGLAGLRVGYAVGPEEVIALLRSVSLPFGVTDISAAAVVASLEAVDELTDRVDAVVAERERVVDALVAMGYDLPATEANFYWLPLGGDSAAFTAECEALGITVRPFANEGVRVTVGQAEDNDLVLEVARRFAP